MRGNVWNIDKMLEFKALIASRPDLPYSVIGAMFGISRNAAIGKAHRMGLNHFKPPKTKEELKPKQKPAPPPKQPSVQTEPPPALDLSGRPYNPLTAPTGACRWVHGLPEDPGVHYCGNPVKSKGYAWCAFHGPKVYVPGTAKSQKGA